MGIWFLDDPQRLQTERNSIAELLAADTWLRSARWGLSSTHLAVEATIRAHEHDYHVVLEYPPLFPEVPAFVRSANTEELWSQHQYLSGTLCLEWGPDTWHPSVTGAQLLESTFKLFHTENPLGEGRHQEVISRHEQTIGQELRHQLGHVVITTTSQRKLQESTTEVLHSKFVTVSTESSLVFLLHSIEQPGHPVWIDEAIPSGLTSRSECDGLYLNTALPGSIFDSVSDRDALLSHLDPSQSEILRDLLSTEGLQILTFGSLDVALRSFLYSPCDDNSSHLHKLNSVIVDTDDLSSRLPPQLSAVTGKRVGIVGLGSIGSKVAVSLGRSGVKDFLFVDPDILLPGNIVRHELDWRNIGEHKIDGVKRELAHVAAGMSVETIKVSLGGQESSSFLSHALERLGQCDIILDATADANAFNFLAGVSISYAKPLVWAEVYTGGIGGFIGRSRPEIDPPPQSMRRQYFAFTTEHGNGKFPVAELNYGGVIEDRPMQATDADVMIFAGHVTRFVLDTLSPEPSIFPYSMYAVGLQEAWIFSAPFNTIPIVATSTPMADENQQHDETQQEEAVDFIRQLLQKDTDAPDSSVRPD